MERETSIRQLIQQLMPKQTEIIIGKVISENPLSVQAVNDEKLLLGKNTLILSKKFREEPLSLGDEIHILVFNDRKCYYALDRR